MFAKGSTSKTNQMRLLQIISAITIIASVFICCKSKSYQTAQKNSDLKNIEHHFIGDDSSCNCQAQFELTDSGELRHIKKQFYKSVTGHLYEKTTALKESENADTLKPNDYFNGVISQEIDAETFEVLDGWYAFDKNNIYYYRPVSGGMLNVKLDSADRKTFRILKGQYKYAMDKKYFYNEMTILKNYKPSETIIETDDKGNAILLKQHSLKRKLDN